MNIHNDSFTPFLIYNADSLNGYAVRKAINELKGNVTFGIENAERCKTRFMFFFV